MTSTSWIERSLVRYGYGWSVPAAGEQRVGVASYEPRDHVRRPTMELAERLERDPVRYQGNWFPHRLGRYARFSASHSRAFGWRGGLQWLVPRLPPRVLTFALRALARQALVDRAFGWYLDQAHPAFIGADRSAGLLPRAMRGADADIERGFQAAGSGSGAQWSAEDDRTSTVAGTSTRDEGPRGSE